MLEIIFLILKIIAILLIALFSLTVFILFLIFFAPVKYKSIGHKNGSDFSIYASITYLNPLVNITVRYPEAYIVQVKILFFTVYNLKSTKDPVSDTTDKSHSTDKTIIEADKMVPNASADRTAENFDEAGKALETTEHIPANVTDEDIKESPPKTNDTNSKDAMQDIPANKASAADIIHKIIAYISLFQENKALVLEVLKTVLRAFKTILPRKCHIKAVLGTGQADQVGYIYAVYCYLLGLLPKGYDIDFEPVWIEKRLEGEYFIKGRMRLIYFLIAVVKVITNKNVRQLYKKIRSV